MKKPNTAGWLPVWRSKGPTESPPVMPEKTLPRGGSSGSAVAAGAVSARTARASRAAARRMRR